MDQPTAEVDRGQLILQIMLAFDGVTREGGLCMSQAAALDVGRPVELAEIAHINDPDRSWVELLEDEDFVPGALDFCFLDPIGVRYYCAPAMIRALNGDPSGHVLNTMFEPIEPMLPYIEVLNDAQKASVALFFYTQWKEGYDWLAKSFDPISHCIPPKPIDADIPKFWLDLLPAEYR